LATKTILSKNSFFYKNTQKETNKHNKYLNENIPIIKINKPQNNTGPSLKIINISPQGYF
jgi:hypothetical protein